MSYRQPSTPQPALAIWHYQRLRKLPDAAARTLRSAGRTASDLRRRVAVSPGLDLSRVRESAQRNAAAAAAKAASAQKKAIAGYRRLVAHGERVLAEREERHVTVQADPAAELTTDTQSPVTTRTVRPRRPTTDSSRPRVPRSTYPGSTE